MFYVLKMNIPRINSLLTSNSICQIICYNYFKSQIKYFSLEILNTEESDKKKKKKTIRIPEVKLIYPDESVTINILDEARKIAKHQGYQLLKMPYIDNKDGRDVYKLCTTKEFIESQKAQNKINESVKFKSTKLISMKSKIAQHDLQTKTNHINKLLEKRYKVKILIMNNPDHKEKIELQQFLKKNVKGKMQTETTKSNMTVMVFEPLLNDNKDTTESTVDIPQC